MSSNLAPTILAILSAAVSDAAASVQFSGRSPFVVNDYVVFEDTNELARITSQAGYNVSLIRGLGGTFAASHAAGVTVRIAEVSDLVDPVIKATTIYPLEIVAAHSEAVLISEPFDYPDGNIGGLWVVAWGDTLHTVLGGKMNFPADHEEYTSFLTIPSFTGADDFVLTFVYDPGTAPTGNSYIEVGIGELGTSSRMSLQFSHTSAEVIRNFTLAMSDPERNVNKHVTIADSGNTTENNSSLTYTIGAGPHTIGISYVASTFTASVLVDGVSVGSVVNEAYRGSCHDDGSVVASENGVSIDGENDGAEPYTIDDLQISFTASIPSTISADAANGSTFEVELTADGVGLEIPDNARNGQKFTWIIHQDQTGGWGLDLSAFDLSVIPQASVSTDANTVTILEGYYIESLQQVKITSCRVETSFNPSGLPDALTPVTTLDLSTELAELPNTLATIENCRTRIADLEGILNSMGLIVPRTYWNGQAHVAADGLTLTIGTHDTIDNAEGADDGGFTLSGVSIAVTAWAASGSSIVLTLASAVQSGDTVTLSYDGSQPNIRKGRARGTLRALVEVAVENNSTVGA